MDNLFNKEDNTKPEPEPAPKRKKKTASRGDRPVAPTEPESFEAALSELEELVKNLESGQFPLEESVNIYKRARELAAWCYKRLNEVQGELKKLGLDENGNFVLEDLPPLE